MGVGSGQPLSSVVVESVTLWRKSTKRVLRSMPWSKGAGIRMAFFVRENFGRGQPATGKG